MTTDEAQSPPPGRTRPLLVGLFGGERWASMTLPQFRWLMAGTAFAQIASWMEEVARGWLILSFTHSSIQLGVFAFVRGISQLVVSPFAGVLIDRLDRRQLAVVTQLVPGANSLGIAVLVSTGQLELWMLYPLVAIGGVAAAINMPARQVLVYDVVGPDYITNAIALNAVVSNGARIMAPIAGGATIAPSGSGRHTSRRLCSSGWRLSRRSRCTQSLTPRLSTNRFSKAFAEACATPEWTPRSRASCF